MGGEQGFEVLVRPVNLILSMKQHAGHNISQPHGWAETGTRHFAQGERESD